MLKYISLSIITIILFACQLDAKQQQASLFVALKAETAIPTATFTAVPPPTETSSPIPVETDVSTPISTATPVLISSDLSTAHRAYEIGDYGTARLEFEALVADPATDPAEKRIALHWLGRSQLKAEQPLAAIETLKQFLEQYPEDALARAAQFNLGVAYEQAEQFQEAAAAYQGSLIPDDVINLYIYERIGDVLILAQDYGGAIAAYQKGIEATEDETYQMHLYEGIAQAELGQNNPLAAISRYETILGMATEDYYRAKILRLMGDAYLLAGDTSLAHEKYLEAVDNYPRAIDSYTALVKLVEANVPVSDLQRGLVDYYAGAYQPAITALDRYLTTPLPTYTPTPTFTPSPTPTPLPTTSEAITSTTSITEATIDIPPPATPLPTPWPPHADDAIWVKALSWQALGSYPNAITTFQELIDTYPYNANWGRAHLEIGYSYSYQGNEQEAERAFRDFAAQNPDHDLAPEALWRAAWLELDDDIFDEAYVTMRDLALQYPAHDYASSALYWAGQAAYAIEEYEKAIEVWARLVQNYPDSELVSFGKYWKARALLALEQSAEAETILTDLVTQPPDYYVLRGRDLLAGSQPHSVPLALPSPAQLSQEQAEAEAWLKRWLKLTEGDDLDALSPLIRNDLNFQRGEALLHLGLRPEALAEFEEVKDDWWDSATAMYQLALYFRDKGLARLSIISAARLIFLSPADGVPEDAPIFIQRLYYPIYYADVIFAEAEKLDLDPALILAIMRQESLFEREAESIAGARGLMQVMPATGEYVATRSDFPTEYESDLLWLPYVSIKFGAWYIDQQLGIFEGQQFAALAAYNAGPGNVLEWLKVSDDLDIFVENIPYFESRLYIRKVYVNLAAYRRIYGLTE